MKTEIIFHLSVRVVPWQPVVPPPLHVEGDQVQPPLAPPALEQMVGHVWDERVVPGLPLLGGQTADEVVEQACTWEEAKTNRKIAVKLL